MINGKKYDVILIKSGNFSKWRYASNKAAVFKQLSLYNLNGKPVLVTFYKKIGTKKNKKLVNVGYYNWSRF